MSDGTWLFVGICGTIALVVGILSYVLGKTNTSEEDREIDAAHTCTDTPKLSDPFPPSHAIAKTRDERLGYTTYWHSHDDLPLGIVASEPRSIQTRKSSTSTTKSTDSYANSRNRDDDTFVPGFIAGNLVGSGSPDYDFTGSARLEPISHHHEISNTLSTHSYTPPSPSSYETSSSPVSSSSGDSYGGGSSFSSGGSSCDSGGGGSSYSSSSDYSSSGSSSSSYDSGSSSSFSSSD